MTQTDPVSAALNNVNAVFPSAPVAFLGGSSTTRQRTVYSDLDIVIVESGQQMPCRQTTQAGDWLVEAFFHNDASLAHYWRLDVEARRPALIRMCADGRILRGEGGPADSIQQRARELLDSGPLPCTAEQLDYRRYILTDLRDDLRGSTNSTERLFITNALIVQAAELAQLTVNAWLGNGKWLARELHEAAPELAESFATIGTSPTDPELLETLLTLVLDLAGGPLQDGYRSQGELPDPQQEPPSLVHAFDGTTRSTAPERH